MTDTTRDAAGTAFEEWYKGLRLDDKVGAECAKVSKRTLMLVFRVGFDRGISLGYYVGVERPQAPQERPQHGPGWEDHR